MNVIEGIRSRKTFRGFTGKSLSRDLVREILQDGHSAPSASNMQPWEFYVLTGKSLADLFFSIDDYHRTEKIKYNPSKDKKIPNEYLQRRKDLFRGLKPYIADLGDGQKTFIESGSIRFYDAPVVVFLVTDHELPDTKLLDIGMAAENIMLSAHARGLATCAIAYTLLYAEPIRKTLQLHAQKDIVLSVCLGYPDTDFPVNQFRSDRVDLDKVITWQGF